KIRARNNRPKMTERHGQKRRKNQPRESQNRERKRTKESLRKDEKTFTPRISRDDQHKQTKKKSLMEQRNVSTSTRKIRYTSRTKCMEKSKRDFKEKREKFDSNQKKKRFSTP